MSSSLQVMFNSSDCATVTSMLHNALISEDSTFDKVLVIVGGGGNGKTFLMNALEEAFSSKVARGFEHKFIQDSTASNRLVWVECKGETPSGELAHIVKDALASYPKTLFVLLCNKLPFNPQDAALFRRLQVVVCNDRVLFSDSIVEALQGSDINKSIEDIKAFTL